MDLYKICFRDGTFRDGIWGRRRGPRLVPLEELLPASMGCQSEGPFLDSEPDRT